MPMHDELEKKGVIIGRMVLAGNRLYLWCPPYLLIRQDASEEEEQRALSDFLVRMTFGGAIDHAR